MYRALGRSLLRACAARVDGVVLDESCRVFGQKRDRVSGWWNSDQFRVSRRAALQIYFH